MKVFQENINIIIINYCGKLLTESCINSVIASKIPESNIIIVDNASTDNSVMYFSQKFPSLKIVTNEANLGYAGAVNAGMKFATKEYAIISNNDVIFCENSIINLISALHSYPYLGAVSPQQIFPDGSWQRSGGYIPSPSNSLNEIFLIPAIDDMLKMLRFKWKIQSPFIYPQYLDGAVIAVKRDIFNKLQGFDSDFFFYSEEADFCYRLTQSDYKIAIVTNANVIHLRGGSSKEIIISDTATQMLINAKVKFLKKHFENKRIKTYIKSVIINHNIYLILWKMLHMLFPKKKQISSKINYFSKSLDLWKDVMADLQK